MDHRRKHRVFLLCVDSLPWRRVCLRSLPSTGSNRYNTDMSSGEMNRHSRNRDFDVSLTNKWSSANAISRRTAIGEDWPCTRDRPTDRLTDNSLPDSLNTTFHYITHSVILGLSCECVSGLACSQFFCFNGIRRSITEFVKASQI
jgi:hypothetical protein